MFLVLYEYNRNLMENVKVQKHPQTEPKYWKGYTFLLPPVRPAALAELSAFIFPVISFRTVYKRNHAVNSQKRGGSRPQSTTIMGQKWAALRRRGRVLSQTAHKKQHQHSDLPAHWIALTTFREHSPALLARKESCARECQSCTKRGSSYSFSMLGILDIFSC